MTIGFVAALAFATWTPAATASDNAGPFVDMATIAELVAAAGELSLDMPQLVQSDGSNDSGSNESGSRDDGSMQLDDRQARMGNAPMSSAGSASTPQGRPLGVGLQLGYPTALSVKYMLRPDQGIAGGIGGFSGFAYDVGAFSLHADYVYHPHVLTSSEVFALTWYVGAGGNVVVFGNPRQKTFLPGLTYYYFPTTVWVGARVPIGVNLAFAQQPFELFLEATPSLLLFPGISFGLGASVGGRFYF